MKTSEDRQHVLSIPVDLEIHRFSAERVAINYECFSLSRFLYTTWRPQTEYSVECFNHVKKIPRAPFTEPGASL